MIKVFWHWGSSQLKGLVLVYKSRIFKENKKYFYVASEVGLKVAGLGELLAAEEEGTDEFHSVGSRFGQRDEG